ncbi:diphosphoinositol polyphosphate phosphohydrolase aps1 [Microsporum canis CBS 113480]|uniref:Diphosphoinositol polyphosphate phosphohydrolase aps1 n=1 Tax=Arthroderma otae (strain ATCC MYA-4605 / CBS 113480) TaxID=554155 RepID=C5FPK7_ARTOC|nr:diphosphoinositol polyphosphate phosphohydrolase aps1 [Microsporum canis CBS 113480]EEQ31523.1 diphosphoinositol polyphosphate phosphohydrolase aps1 [Microsporum canis CBS 113480]
MATRTMEARTGRTNQRYSPSGERLVAGVVPLSADKSKVLLIQSARPGSWVLPKGGWELDEPTAHQAACREAWEEAGVVCTVTRDLGKIQDMRSPVQISAKAPRVLYHFFEVRVDREESQWPEMHKRKRQWVTYAQAAAALVARPELLDALNRSSVKR